MCRACGLAGRSTCLVAVDAVLVPVILRPFMLTPCLGIGQFMLGILDGAVVSAEFLTKFDGTGGAILYAAAAGDAVLGVYLCHIGAAAHVGGIEQLGCTEGVADLDVAVADCEYLPFTVDVCNLMHETVVFSLLENGHGLIVGNVMAAAGFAEVVCHVTDADAPVAVIVGTAFFQFLAAVTAAADAYSKMAFILFEPVGDMLDVDGLILHGNGLFYRNDMHADT